MIDSFVAFKWNLEDFIKILYLPVRGRSLIMATKAQQRESEPDKLFTDTSSRPNRARPVMCHNEARLIQNELIYLTLLDRRCRRTWRSARTSWRLWSSWLPIIPLPLRRLATWRRWCRICWYVCRFCSRNIGFFLEMFEKGLVLYPWYNPCFEKEIRLICVHPALIISSSCSLHVFFAVHVQILLNICCRSSQDAKIDPEEFTSRLQSELKSSPQPYLVPFLKVR